MSNLFLQNFNQQQEVNDDPAADSQANSSSSQQQQDSWFLNHADLESFRKKYQQENQQKRLSSSSAGSYGANGNSPQQQQQQGGSSSSAAGNDDSGYRYRSMVEGFMNEDNDDEIIAKASRSRSTSSSGTAGGGMVNTGGLFLPFMESQQGEKSQPVSNDQQQQQQDQSTSSQQQMGFFSQQYSSPQQPQQQQMSPSPQMNYNSYESSPQQQQYSSPQQPQMFNPNMMMQQGGTPPNAEAMRQFMFMQQMMQQSAQQHQSPPQQQFMMPPMQQPQQQQQQQYGSPSHVQQFASNLGAPTPAPSPQTPQAAPKQQNLEDQFTEKLNLQKQEESTPTKAKTKDTTDAASTSSSDNKPRSKKSSIENQLVYLYPRYGKMDRSYTTLSNVHVRYGSFMSTPDVYFIARNHLRDLNVENPFVDDYYFQIFRTKEMKSVPPQFTKWIKQDVKQRQKPPAKEPGPQYDTRLFGRIAGITPKAPRVVVDDVTSPSELPASSQLNQSRVHIMCGIEDCYDQLLLIEELVMCDSLKSSQKTTIDFSEMRKMSEQVFEFIKAHLEEILSLEKGVKFVGKALKILPEAYSYKSVEFIFSNWDALNKKDDGLFKDSALLSGICVSIQKLEKPSQVTRLVSALVPAQNILTTRIRSPGFVQVLALIMKRIDDLRRKMDRQTADEWKQTFSSLIFQNLKQLGFKSIVDVQRDDLAWFLLASLVLHCSKQQRQQLLNSVKSLTQTKEAKSSEPIQSFLTVVKQQGK